MHELVVESSKVNKIEGGSIFVMKLGVNKERRVVVSCSTPQEQFHTEVLLLPGLHSQMRKTLIQLCLAQDLLPEEAILSRSAVVCLKYRELVEDARR
jgi:hypothetical protein